ncbi:hypothetical protein [Pricia antarctica]|nr:hypothetical protein [Pricia antarctica]
METKEVAKEVKTGQIIQLIKGEFSPSEASLIISTLIDQKINFHKMQRLQHWEGNHGFETSELDGRIKELVEEKRTAKEFFAAIKGEKRKLKIDGVIKIEDADS